MVYYTLEELEKNFSHPNSYSPGTLIKKLIEATITLNSVEGHTLRPYAESKIFLENRINEYEESLNKTFQHIKYPL